MGVHSLEASGKCEQSKEFSRPGLPRLARLRLETAESNGSLIPAKQLRKATSHHGNKRAACVQRDRHTSRPRAAADSCKEVDGEWGTRHDSSRRGVCGWIRRSR